MAKRKNDTLARKKPMREYRPVCWVSAEGTTEKDYLRMNVFRCLSNVAIRFPKNVHPHRRHPGQVLKRFVKAMREEDFRKNDEAWILVDVDDWGLEELAHVLVWANEDPRYHVAISNPKFELFLVMHFEAGNGCTTSQRIDAALRRHMQDYDKHIMQNQFDAKQIAGAVENARIKRSCCNDAVPGPGMTDVHLLVGHLLDLG